MNLASKILILLVIIIVIFEKNLYSLKEETTKKNPGLLNINQNPIKHYNKYQKTTKDINLYNDNFTISGIIKKNTIVELNNTNIPSNLEYLKIKINNDTYFIKKTDIENGNKEVTNDRYKKYIKYNENIITNNKTIFYNDEDNIVYIINKSYNLPIIIKDGNKYGVEFNNKLFYLKEESIQKIIFNNNTKEKNSTGIPVLNYHFVYKPEEEKCNQEICHTEEQFREHLKYIKENAFFTPTMKELEMYIDGKIQLPKSVVVTIDDGRNVNLATKIIDEYELQATAFIVTGRFNMERDFIRSNNIEFHSHSHNLHNAGSCPPGHGQGGGLTCFKDEDILEDLRKSREILNGSRAFCYPFYEYNNHSIELLKKAGFTMAFAGEYAGGKTKVEVGIDKYKLPRWVIVTYTTMDKFKNYVNGVG